MSDASRNWYSVSSSSSGQYQTAVVINGNIYTSSDYGLTWDISNNIVNSNFTEPTPAMPDDCKIENDSIASYRKYYKLYKNHIANWKLRNIPNWYLV